MVREQHNRPQVSIRSLPVELHDKVMHNVATRSDLRACALSLRVWRYSAQKALHRDVIVTDFDFDVVLPRYATPPHGNKLAMNLTRFPRSLTLKECRRNSCFCSNELAEFARHCGEGIESLNIDDCIVVDFYDMIAVVATFPFLKELHITKTTWLSDSSRFLRHSDIPRAPATLETVSLVCMQVESPIARWLVHTPGLKISTAHWTCNPLHEDATAESSGLFREIGRFLTQLSLRIDGNWVDDSFEGAPVDFSMNTCLSKLTVTPLGIYTPGTLHQVLSTVNSPVLETIQLSMGEDRRPYKFYKDEISKLVKVILQSGRFSGLKTVAVYAPDDLRRSSLLWLLSDLGLAGIAVEILEFDETEADEADMNLQPLLSDLTIQSEEGLGEPGVFLPLLSELGDIADGEPEEV